MIPTLISTATETDVVSIDITSGIDSTYDHYMFVCTDINPAADGHNFGFQVNAAGASGFNETMATTFWKSKHRTDDTTYFAYTTSQDQANGTSYQNLVLTTGSGTEESLAGILHLFSPSNTTFVKHFYARFTNNESSDYIEDTFVAGYINTTTAIDEISFKNSSGNMAGVIQMYGIE